ncbi:spherulation-specific family 4 protein [Streptomyces sp. C10-9-1]|uniref:spherulation-specific family 4 protein n=1 Tax=Streptomyces sp. C10-9-1 TaxID=1859285 RepID=UPI002112DAC7|nr:spherulation-specific family 4 protein [Streptomyces sp. C10-9-1]MCQ6554808.1 spherulation-specific family 4 protein [Streptomyces sp. C10-9-1]
MNSTTMTAGIPLYVHPAVDSRAWAALATPGQPVSWVVVNQSSGPGDPEDTDLTDAASAVIAAGATVCGYVDHNYGAVVDFTVVTQATEWVSRGIKGVFLDRVSADEADLQAVGATVLLLRKAGVEYVILNCGTLPAAGYLDIADTVVTFEGTMAAYEALSAPEWTQNFPPERMSHLVYEAAAEDVTEAVRLARRRGVHHLYVTDGTFASGNPWGGLPDYWAPQAQALTRYPARPTHRWVR